MDIGTVDTVDEPIEPKRGRIGRTGGTGSSGGGGGGSNGKGPGGDGPRDGSDFPSTGFVPGKSRILTGFLLLVVMMTFGGLIAAYIVVSTNRAIEWQPFTLPIQVWISTALIIVSSITYHVGQKAIVNDDQLRAKRWMIVTTVLGAAFISSQLLAWLALSARGLYVASNPYAGFFYIITAVHAVHVLGGVIALGSIVLRVWDRAASHESLAKRVTLAQVVGWYWHFMGGLWLILVILLGFWK